MHTIALIARFNETTYQPNRCRLGVFICLGKNVILKNVWMGSIESDRDAIQLAFYRRTGYLA